MPNSKVKNELCGQNHKMSNAYVDKFGRYINDWLDGPCTIKCLLFI